MCWWLLWICTNYCFLISLLHSSTCFEHYVLIIRRSNCIIQHLVSSHCVGGRVDRTATYRVWRYHETTIRTSSISRLISIGDKYILNRSCRLIRYIFCPTWFPVSLSVFEIIKQKRGFSRIFRPCVRFVRLIARIVVREMTNVGFGSLNPWLLTYLSVPPFQEVTRFDIRGRFSTY